MSASCQTEFRRSDLLITKKSSEIVGLDVRYEGWPAVKHALVSFEFSFLVLSYAHVYFRQVRRYRNALESQWMEVAFILRSVRRSYDCIRRLRVDLGQKLSSVLLMRVIAKIVLIRSQQGKREMFFRKYACLSEWTALLSRALLCNIVFAYCGVSVIHARMGRWGWGGGGGNGISVGTVTAAVQKRK